MSPTRAPSESPVQPAAERRTAEAEVKRLVALFSPAHAKLVAAARRFVEARVPTAHQLVYEYRDCFVLSYTPNGKGIDGVFGIRGSADGVRLYLHRGKGLDDPKKLLQGTGGLVRYVPLESAATLKRAEVVELVDAALAGNAIPFAKSGRGPLVLQSVTKPKAAGAAAKAPARVAKKTSATGATTKGATAKPAKAAKSKAVPAKAAKAATTKAAPATARSTAAKATSKSAPSRDLFVLAGATARSKAVDAFLTEPSGELGALARMHFDALRRCGQGVQELMHDGQASACLGDAAFAYVSVHAGHVNLGFFHGAALKDPAKLLQGTGKFMRHVKLVPREAFDRAAIAALIDAAYRDVKARVAAAKA